VGDQLRAKFTSLHFMTPIPAEVVAAEKQGVHYQVIVQIRIPKYRGSFNTLVFGERKPYRGSLKDGRLELVYHQDPCFRPGESFPLWTLRR
jgi:hypothetical protein